jgi:hypothetical protein
MDIDIPKAKDLLSYLALHSTLPSDLFWRIRYQSLSSSAPDSLFCRLIEYDMRGSDWMFSRRLVRSSMNVQVLI